MSHFDDTLKIDRVACYIRVSSEEQRIHGISLDAQRDKLTEYATNHNLKIVGWYEDEGISGRKLIRKRPALQRMLNDASNGLFDRIIFIKLDRFFRSVAEYHECMKIIDPVVWTATEEKYDLTTANGRAFVNMKLTIAELEADQTGERIKIVNDYKVKTGQPLSGSQGTAYTIQKIDGVKHVVKNPNTKDMVADYLNYFLVNQNKVQSYLYIANKYDIHVTHAILSRILTDTKIYGYYRGNPNYCEPYVTKEEYDKIQETLKRNIKKTPSKHVYLYTGLIVCPCCGRKLASSYSDNRTNRKPSGKVYHYNKLILNYRCNKHSVDHTCEFNKRINEEKLERQLLDNIELYVNSYIASVTVQDNIIDVNRVSIENKIDQIKSEMKNTTTAFMKSRLSEEEYDKAYTELETRLSELESRLKPAPKRDISAYTELLNSGWRSIYDALNKENKRAFWRKYIDRIEVDKDGKLLRVIFF